MKSVCIVLFQNVELPNVACQHTLPCAHNRYKGFTHACVTVPLIALPFLCLSLHFRLPFFSLVSPLWCTCRSPLHPLCVFMLPHSVLYLYTLISISLGFHCTLYWLNIINRQRCTEASIGAPRQQRWICGLRWEWRVTYPRWVSLFHFIHRNPVLKFAGSLILWGSSSYGGCRTVTNFDISDETNKHSQGVESPSHFSVLPSRSVSHLWARRRKEGGFFLKTQS